MARFDSILLGDNAFYGIDHLSHARARERAEAQSLKNAINVIRCAREQGIAGLMVATRPRLEEIVQELEKEGLNTNLDYYPVMPYARGLQLKLSEKGILNMVRDISKQAGIKEEIRIIARGGLGFLQKDFDALFKIFIDTEILKLRSIRPNIIYLHPIIVDLALALDLRHIFEIFQEHLMKRYNIRAGLCTKNFSTLVEKLKQWDIKVASIMTSFNPVGFLMNPTRESCEETLKNYDGHVMAMNIFGGGFVSLDDVISYIESIPEIRNVVVGVSSVEHAKQTFARLSGMR